MEILERNKKRVFRFFYNHFAKHLPVSYSRIGGGYIVEN